MGWEKGTWERRITGGTAVQRKKRLWNWTAFDSYQKRWIRMTSNALNESYSYSGPTPLTHNDGHMIYSVDFEFDRFGLRKDSLSFWLSL